MTTSRPATTNRPGSAPTGVRVGVDLVRMGGLGRLARRPWFARYVYASDELASAGELAASRREEFLAGRFAAKEAVLKVLGVGLFDGVAPRDIVLRRSAAGRPVAELRLSAASAARRAGLTTVAVSITHCHGLVVAIAFGS